MIMPVYQWENLRGVLTSVLRLGIHVLLYGPPGTGKSYLAKTIAADLSSQYLHISLPEDAMSAEIIGHRVPSSTGSWDWHDGPMLIGHRQGFPVIVDEIDHGSAEAQTRMYQILDRVPVTLPTGEVVLPAARFSCIATMNGTPDPMNPLYNRFAVRIEIPEPLQEMIDALPEKYQQAAQSSWKPTNPSTRQWFALARMSAEIPDEHALELLFPGRGAEMLTALRLSEEL